MLNNKKYSLFVCLHFSTFAKEKPQNLKIDSLAMFSMFRIIIKKYLFFFVLMKLKPQKVYF